MTITLNTEYDVALSTALLGYVGETNARPVSVEGLAVDGADRYVLTIDYGDGTIYEVDITGGQWTPTADILGRYNMTNLQKKMAEKLGLSQEDFEKPTVTEQDKIMAQVLYTAAMTGTLIGEEGE